MYLKNVQLRLFICLVWSSGDIPRVYGSFGVKTVKFEGRGAFIVGPTPLPCYQAALRLSPFIYFAAPISYQPSLSLLSSIILSSLILSHFEVRRSKPPPPTTTNRLETLGNNPRSPLDRPSLSLAAENDPSSPDFSIIAVLDNKLGGA